LEAQVAQLQRERAVLAAAQPVANPATADLSAGQVIANPIATATPDTAATATPAPATTAAPDPTPDPTPEPAPAPSPSPAPAPSGGFMCPVFGGTYTDDFSSPPGHNATDIFVPEGTPAYAVKSGTVRYVANEGAGGNTAYLNADDGNSYFYAHLSQFVGGARSVSQGEVIAYTGMTGNASGPHLHFEIRIGGDNGSKTNPYPVLRAAGC
jgi:murein DD-endopeptidase MepM/ murein hydrolase activator NlpD